MTPLDKRLNAFRDDLADEALKGRCEALRFVTPETARCVAPVAAVHRAPASDTMQVTQALYGETVQVFERKDNWAWVQLQRDGYVGYVQERTLAAPLPTTTHHVTTASAHLFPRADLKSQPAVALPMNAELVVNGTSGAYLAVTSGQFVFADHAQTTKPTDFVSVAERFLHTPYLWGGKSIWGVDCSGLVQVALQACGVDVLRDSHMQEQTLGQIISGENLRRGDLVFWKGHVGIMQDAEILLHANGHHLLVVSEPLRHAVERIAAKGSAITAVKRL